MSIPERLARASIPAAKRWMSESAVFFRQVAKPSAFIQGPMRSYSQSLDFFSALAKQIPLEKKWPLYFGTGLATLLGVQQLTKEPPRSLPEEATTIKAKDLIDAGPGRGAQGRNRPTLVEFHDDKGDIVFGYKKTLPPDRLANELLYYALMNRVFPDDLDIPRAFIVNETKPGGQPDYKLLAESIGENQSLVSFILSPAFQSDESRLSSEPIPGLGCSLAFSNMIGSSDSFMKNHVVVHHEGKASGAYPIDFELGGGHLQILADLSIDPKLAAESMVDRGVLPEYSKDMKGPWTGHLVTTAAPDGGMEMEIPTEIGTGMDHYGPKARDLAVHSLEHDIRRGAIAEMYQKFASMKDEDLAALVDEVPFLRAAEKKHQVLELIEQRNKVKQILGVERIADTTSFFKPSPQQLPPAPKPPAQELPTPN